jgi:hypothetical protein
MNSIALDEKSQKIIRDTLNISSLDDIVDRDYNDRVPRDEKEKLIAEGFGSFNRGSARFVMRSFYTSDELRMAEDKSNHFTLP